MKYAIGIDIGGTTIASGIINEKGDLIQQEVVDSDPTDRETMFSQVITCIKRLMNHSSIPLKEIDGIGAGVPGKVDRDNGIAVFQNNLPWSNFPFVKRMREAFPIERVVMDNDVYMAAFAEWKKAAIRDHELFIYMTVSTGISCAIIQGGDFIRGAGFAGEIGLVPVYAPYAEQSLERLEQAAAGPAITKLGIKQFQDDTMTAKKVFQAYYNGDRKAKELIEQIASSLAQGVYMLVSLFDPHQIVFGGTVITHNPVLFKRVMDKLDDLLIVEQKHILQNIACSDMGYEQSIIGAGLRAME